MFSRPPIRKVELEVMEKWSAKSAHPKCCDYHVVLFDEQHLEKKTEGKITAYLQDN